MGEAKDLPYLDKLWRTTALMFTFVSTAGFAFAPKSDVRLRNALTKGGKSAVLVAAVVSIEQSLAVIRGKSDRLNAFSAAASATAIHHALLQRNPRLRLPPALFSVLLTGAAYSYGSPFYSRSHDKC